MKTALLLLSVIFLSSCGSSSRGTGKELTFRSCDAYAKKGQSVRFICRIMLDGLKANQRYRATATFTSAYGEYAAKTDVKEFNGDLSIVEFVATDFKQLSAGGLHHVHVSLTTIKKPKKVIATLRKPFLFTKITSEMAQSLGLKTRVVGADRRQIAADRAAGRNLGSGQVKKAQ